MRVLIAPDCYTGTLTAAEAAGAIAAGWRRHAAADVVDLCPLSDGGPGFVAVLAEAMGPGGSRLSVPTTGPLGQPVTAQVVLVPAPAGGAGAGPQPGPAPGPQPGHGPGPTAYVEAAQACGLHLVPPGRRDPSLTTTAGLSAPVLAARRAGADTIVLGLGGSGTNDGGAGLVAGLAEAAGLGTAATLARLRGGGAALHGMHAEQLSWLPRLRQIWDGVLVAASDVDVPLLGLSGASAGFAAQKGATAEQAQHLERCLADWAVATAGALGVSATGSAGIAALAGAGAAGGLGFAVQLLGGRRLAGAGAVLQAVGFATRAAAADLVVTGEGRLDWQSLHGKVTHAVARAGLEVGTPVIAVPGQLLVGRRELATAGFSAVYPVAVDEVGVSAALADPAATLAARAARVARTWSPSRD